MRLNLGSGPEFIPGFINIDNSMNILLSRFRFFKNILFKFGVINTQHLSSWDKRIVKKNILKLKYSENSIDYIYSSHFLEHIYFWDAKKLLQKCHLFLKNDGLLRLALPDYDQFICDYVINKETDPYNAIIELEYALLSHPLERPDFFERHLPWNSHIHKWHPTASLVIKTLENIGFKNIKIKNFQVGSFPDLNLVENRKDHTFYIEATK